MMKLEDLGYSEHWEECRNEMELASFDMGRVSSEHKERYTVMTGKGQFEAEIVGNLRFSATTRADFPAVGDWVAISSYDDNKVLIHAVFPRYTVIERQAVGKMGEKQIIAANIDYALIVQAVDRDFSINRIERYLAICHAAGVKPIVLLNKIDLVEKLQLDEMVEAIKKRIDGVPIIAISNESQAGYDQLLEYIMKGITYCLLGSSGVGKSTLLNNIAGKSVMKTDSISENTNRGKHVTSHRELFVLENGGIMIDNPGMREVGIADADSGIDTTFETILKLSQNCRYVDCSHIHERGCAIIEAVNNEELDKASYENYLKLEREKSHFESTVAERRKKDKDFGKMVKEHKKKKQQDRIK